MRFATVVTSRERFAELLGRERPELVVFETGVLAGWVHDLCVELGVKCLVANTVHRIVLPV